ncbi:MAG: hypothetical protein HEP71_34415 [Roseivirga sp.]|nr:hypothetical protein [Roseivirga sp.]
MTFVEEYYFLFLSLILAIVLSSIVRDTLAIKAIRKSPESNEFIFRRNRWSVLWITVFIAGNSLTHWEGWTLGIILLLTLFSIVVAISLIYNSEVVRLNSDSITINGSREKVKVADITGVSITDSEIAIHTKKYINHHRLMTKDLMDKKWPDFQTALEQYASQFDHIEVERA